MFLGLVPTTRSSDRCIRICNDLLFYYDDRPGISPAFVVVYGGYAGLCGVVSCGLCGFRYVVWIWFRPSLWVTGFAYGCICCMVVVLVLSNYIS